MTKTRILYLTIATSMLCVNTSNANASWWDSITQGVNTAAQWVGNTATTVYSTVAPVVTNAAVTAYNKARTVILPEAERLALQAGQGMQRYATQAGQGMQRYATQAYDYTKGTVLPGIQNTANHLAYQAQQTIGKAAGDIHNWAQKGQLARQNSLQPVIVQQAPVNSPLAQQIGDSLAGEVASHQYEAEAAAAAAQAQQVAPVAVAAPQVVVQAPPPAPVAEAFVMPLPPQQDPVIVAAAPAAPVATTPQSTMMAKLGKAIAKKTAGQPKLAEPTTKKAMKGKVKAAQATPAA